MTQPVGLPTTVGQPPSNPLSDSVIEAAVRDAIHQTSFRDETPTPKIGTTPPVAQPGIPPMSQQATDVGRAAMYCGLATVPPGLIAVAIMVASEHADPTVIGMIVAAPAALAIPILAIARLMRRAGEATPAEQHHHYNGPVHQDQRNVKSKTIGLSAKTTNNH